MKNKFTVEAATPANAVQQSSKETERGVIRHNQNRKLPTQTVLECLRAQLPQHYELAEIVGKWVWLDISPVRQSGLANVLWLLGFHWNQRRCVWQHPCGAFAPFDPHPADPRSKYRSYFPAVTKPA